MYIKIRVLVCLPIAVLSLSETCIEISVDDGLVRTSTGFTSLTYSLVLYVDCLKDTIATTWSNNVMNITKIATYTYTKCTLVIELFVKQRIVKIKIFKNYISRDWSLLQKVRKQGIIFWHDIFIKG